MVLVIDLNSQFGSNAGGVSGPNIENPKDDGGGGGNDIPTLKLTFTEHPTLPYVGATSTCMQVTSPNPWGQSPDSEFFTEINYNSYITFKKLRPYPHGYYPTFDHFAKWSEQVFGINSVDDLTGHTISITFNSVDSIISNCESGHNQAPQPRLICSNDADVNCIGTSPSAQKDCGKLFDTQTFTFKVTAVLDIDNFFTVFSTNTIKLTGGESPPNGCLNGQPDYGKADWFILGTITLSPGS